MKKIYAVLLCLFVSLSFFSCNAPKIINDSSVTLVQAGEGTQKVQTCRITTNLGTLICELYPSEAPKCVKNFTELAEKGFYDGKKICFVEQNWALTGSIDSEFKTGKSSNGKGFHENYSENLFHFKGALSMYSDEKTKEFDSRFIIVGDKSVDGETLKKMKDSRCFADKVINRYKTEGGSPSLDYSGYTVFGQITDGFDVLNKIITADTGLNNSVPVEDIVIISVETD